jgi:hypothetical protein
VKILMSSLSAIKFLNFPQYHENSDLSSVCHLCLTAVKWLWKRLICPLNGMKYIWPFLFIPFQVFYYILGLSLPNPIALFGCSGMKAQENEKKKRILGQSNVTRM